MSVNFFYSVNYSSTGRTYTSKTLDYLKAVVLTCGTEERKFATKTTPRIHETPDSREIVLNHFTLCKIFASKRCWLNPLSWRYRAKIVSSPINATKNIRKPKIDPSGSNPAVLLMHGKNGYTWSNDTAMIYGVRIVTTIKIGKKIGKRWTALVKVIMTAGTVWWKNSPWCIPRCFPLTEEGH